MGIRQKYMGVVLFSALVVALESVGVEAAINTFDIESYMVACVPTAVAGLVLLGLMPKAAKEVASGLGRHGWAVMVGASAFSAAGILMWFDAVGRIGASKEALLGGGSSEVLFIVLLSAVFLSERLSRFEAAGSALVLVGVFMVLVKADSLSLSVGFGEVEAIVSSLLLAFSVVMTAVLLRSHKLVAISGLELLVSGTLLLVAGVPLGLMTLSGAEDMFVLIGLGAFPVVGMVTYYAGIQKIGASLTSVLFALTGVMTIGVQLLVLLIVPGADIRLPSSLSLAVAGGMVAFIGVYLLNKDGHGA